MTAVPTIAAAIGAVALLVIGVLRFIEMMARDVAAHNDTEGPES